MNFYTKIEGNSRSYISVAGSFAQAHDAGISFPKVTRQGRSFQFFRLSRTRVWGEIPIVARRSSGKGVVPDTTFAAVASSQPFEDHSAP